VTFAHTIPLIIKENKNDHTRISHHTLVTGKEGEGENSEELSQNIKP
jgi:hypothetical protein